MHTDQGCSKSDPILALSDLLNFLTCSNASKRDASMSFGQMPHNILCNGISKS